MARVLLTRRIPSSVLTLLESRHTVELYSGDGAIPREELLRRVADKEALLCVLTDRIDAAVVAAAPALKVVANIAVGYENIDVPAVRARGIAVTNTPDVLTEAVAEFTWGLILAVARRIAEGDRLVRAGAWKGFASSRLTLCCAPAIILQANVVSTLVCRPAASRCRHANRVPRSMTGVSFADGASTNGTCRWEV